jgi:hypothetical protein
VTMSWPGPLPLLWTNSLDFRCLRKLRGRKSVRRWGQSDLISAPVWSRVL